MWRRGNSEQMRPQAPRPQPKPAAGGPRASGSNAGRGVRLRQARQAPYYLPTGVRAARLSSARQLHFMPLLLRFLPAAGLLTLALSCQQKPAETTTPPPPAAPVPPATPVVAPTVAQRFSPIISGYWVSADYLDEVSRTRSPATAFDSAGGGISSLLIAPFSNKQDSVEIGASHGLHEGGDLTLLLPLRLAGNALPIRFRLGDENGTTSELAYQITATDTILFHVTRRKQTHQILYKTAYRRTGITKQVDHMEPAVEQGVNRLLVAGSYNGIDSLNKAVHVQFFTDGAVKGLPHTKYFIPTDFTGPNPGNTLVFDAYTEQGEELAAVFGRDTIKLYTILSKIGVPPGEADTTQTFSRGRLRYQLVRLKQP